MCCFSRPVAHVSSTSIFARHVAPGHQALVYAMRFEAAEDVAMVLPLPVAPGSGEEAVRFVSLEGYAGFFTDLASGFPQLYAKSRGPIPQAPRMQTLAVHDVGEFEASHVPTVADFERLDPRFRLDPSVWDALPAYRDHGFAVFRLARTTRGGLFGLFRRSRSRAVHPMAFTFPTRRPDALFFPTVHVHDGEVHAEAAFDHALYAQTAGEAPPREPFWEGSDGPVAGFVDVGRTQGLVHGTQPVWRALLNGTLPNQDTWLAVPENPSA
ncbi:MAG: hypothetical protein H6737_23220 [Alphaproteobacteria bacterium]|nr:hypothetical protein [Alphaproteobacteria bacterium]